MLPAMFHPGWLGQNEHNIGIILGPKSGDLVDIDLDCQEALALADLYLYQTGAEFGRASKPRSHKLYVAAGAIYEAFGDPITGEVLLERRAEERGGGAHQTMAPLVLGGMQGIGKDTILEPAKYAIGPWNFQEVSPTPILGRFNGFPKSVILRVSEARDLGEFDRFQLYDHMKAYIAAPPDVLRIDEKHLREHSIINCCDVIITTNHKADGIFLPADDRRHMSPGQTALKRTQDSRAITGPTCGPTM